MCEFQYLSELSMLETDFYLETLPSILAASSLAIARDTLNLDPWTVELKRRTGYDLSILKKTIDLLSALFYNAPNLPQQAIQEKYKSSKYLEVSLLRPKSETIKVN